MTERWVVNASPLIVLCKIEHQHILEQLAAEIVLPAAVVAEIVAGPADDPARKYLKGEPLAVVDVAPDSVVYTWDLGKGEAAVLSYARQNVGWKAIVDDGIARRCARTLSIPLIGTLGVIIRARQAGILPEAAPVMRAVLEHGFRLDQRIIRQVLWESLGETYE